VLLGLVCVLSYQAVSINLAVSACVLPWVARSRSGRHALKRRMLALIPLLFGLGVSLALLAALSGGASYVTWRDRAAMLGARVLAATLLLCWLTHDLRPAQLEAALRTLRLPGAFVDLVMETSAFGRQLRETLQAAWAACVLRGGLNSLSALRATIGAVAGIVLLRSIDRSERVALASALRAGDAYRFDDARAEPSEPRTAFRPESP
jgi:hypothetical protein